MEVTDGGKEDSDKRGGGGSTLRGMSGREEGKWSRG